MHKSRPVPGRNTAMNAIVRIEDIEAELGPLVRRAVTQRPIKVISRETGLPERYIKSLRQREHQPGSAPFLALAAAFPELKAFVFRLLALEQRDPRTEALLEQMRQWMDARPEEGDRSND